MQGIFVHKLVSIMLSLGAHPLALSGLLFWSPILCSFFRSLHAGHMMCRVVSSFFNLFPVVVNVMSGPLSDSLYSNTWHLGEVRL